MFNITCVCGLGFDSENEIGNCPGCNTAFNFNLVSPTDDSVEPVAVQRELRGYHLKYTTDNIPNVVIEATRELMTKIWRQTNEVRLTGIQAWLTTASETYGLIKPEFEMIQGDEGRIMYARTGGGQYFPDTNKIILYKKHSLTTLIHEYRHAMQFQTNFQGELEEDGRGWSASLFYLADPVKYMTAALAGTIIFA